jgi:hypothetical protein
MCKKIVQPITTDPDQSRKHYIATIHPSMAATIPAPPIWSVEAALEVVEAEEEEEALDPETEAGLVDVADPVEADPVLVTDPDTLTEAEAEPVTPVEPVAVAVGAAPVEAVPEAALAIEKSLVSA